MSSSRAFRRPSGICQVLSAPNRWNRREHGFVSVEFMVAVGFSFLLLVMVANLILIQYGRGLVRASVDEGARAGARFSSNAIQSCETRAGAVAGGMGKLASNVTVKCEIVDGQVRATASADFEGWLPAVPDFHEDATAISGKETAPE